MTWMRRNWKVVLGALAGLVLYASVVVAPWLNVGQARQTQQTASGVKALLNYVASVQNSPQAKASRALVAWVVEDMQAICAATPHAACIPVPKSLQGP